MTGYPAHSPKGGTFNLCMRAATVLRLDLPDHLLLLNAISTKNVYVCTCSNLELQAVDDSTDCNVYDPCYRPKGRGI